MSAFEVCGDVRGFFVEHVTAAMDELRVRAAEGTRAYLVDLLSAFAESERIPDLSRPLVTQLNAAMAVSGAERTARMRGLGDVALFISGFFPDSFDRRGLTEAYVVAVGGRAYLVVARSAARSEGRVFSELAERFRELARVLDEVRERTTLCTDGDVLKLYQRFCDSRSPRLEQRLRRRGVVPQLPGPPN